MRLKARPLILKGNDRRSSCRWCCRLRWIIPMSERAWHWPVRMRLRSGRTLLPF